MNDRYRNVCKAHNHIVKCRTKEGERIFVPRWGYVIIPSDKLLTARIKRNAYKVNREFNEWARKLWMYHAESASLEK
jgi:hypothetical protein